MSKKFIRIIAIILAALFVLSAIIAAAGGALYSLFGAKALEEPNEQMTIVATVTPEAEDNTSSASSILTRPVRVGLFFKNSSYNLITRNHSISSPTGFRFFMKNDSGIETYSFTTSSKSVSIIKEENLLKNDKGSYESASPEEAAIFTFALKMTDSFPNSYSLKQEIAFAKQKAAYNIIYPIFDDGNMYVGIGDYMTEKIALSMYKLLGNVYSRNFALKNHKETYITVIDNATGEIVLRADTEIYPLYVEPNYKTEKSDNEDDGLIGDEVILSHSVGAADVVIEEPEISYDTLPYITTSNGNIYAGAFEYKSNSDGLLLVNILSFDDYIKSVLPYEVYGTWPQEALKAFAVVAKSYAVSGADSFHTALNFDMCCETHCQTYRGRGRSTPYTDACVDAVAGQLLTYNGEVARTFYHAISGGSTESAANAWGSSPAQYPYLISQPIPEEKYQNYDNGIWSSSVTMSELSDYIMSKPSYASRLVAPITDISIEEKTPSGYVYKVKITDSSGQNITITQTDAVRILFSKYAKSANFILARGIPFIKASSVLDTITPGMSYPVLTKSGEDTISSNTPLYAITSNGTAIIENNNSLQFIGKGWGHGVGLSQYGCKDMAELGYTYDKILSIFYPGTVLKKY